VGERITKELNVKHLLEKLRMSYCIINNLMNKSKKELIKFNRETVIVLTENSFSSTSESDSLSEDNLTK